MLVIIIIINLYQFSIIVFCVDFLFYVVVFELKCDFVIDVAVIQFVTVWLINYCCLVSFLCLLYCYLMVSESQASQLTECHQNQNSASDSTIVTPTST